MGAGQGRKQVGAQGGVPLPPFFQHQRAASPPRGARTPVRAPRPRSPTPGPCIPAPPPPSAFLLESSFLRLPSSLCHGRPAPFLSPARWVSPLKTGVSGHQGVRQAWGASPGSCSGAWRVRPSRGRPAASPPLPARLRPEASAGTDRTVFYNVSSSPAFLRGRAQPLCEVASEPPAITCCGSQIVFHFLPPIFKIDDMGSGFPESSLVF